MAAYGNSVVFGVKAALKDLEIALRWAAHVGSSAIGQDCEV